MQPESSQNQSCRVQACLNLVKLEDSGLLDSFECPDCHNPTVSVWFTHPFENEYRTWFLCGECSFESRVQNSERPAHFSEDRVNKRLEAYDADLLSKCKFKRPWSTPSPLSHGDGFVDGTLALRGLKGFAVGGRSCRLLSKSALACDRPRSPRARLS